MLENYILKQKFNRDECKILDFDMNWGVLAFGIEFWVSKVTKGGICSEFVWKIMISVHNKWFNKRLRDSLNFKQNDYNPFNFLKHTANH